MVDSTRRFPKGRVGFAVGDIHGRADLLARMCDRLEAERERLEVDPIVVFLGDYVDRGPDSAEVLELFRFGRPQGFERRFLKGNHEQALLAFIEDPVSNKLWLQHGGLETLISYGVPLPPGGAPAPVLRDCAALFNERLGEWDRNFLNSLERFAEIGDYLFVHAGIDPGAPLDRQSDSTLFWVRGEFLRDKRVAPWRVVHGHTPEVNPFLDARRIGIDTGAYATGVLTAVRLEDERVSFLTVTAR